MRVAGGRVAEDPAPAVLREDDEDADAWYDDTARMVEDARRVLSQQATDLGFEALASAIESDASGKVDLMEAATADVARILRIHPDVARRAVIAGATAGIMIRVLMGAADAALAPAVDDDQ